MRTHAILAVVLALALAAAPVLAAPEVEITKVAVTEMTMNPDNALSQRPFELEGGAGFYHYQGKYNPPPFGLTDAINATAPADDLFHDGTVRFDLGWPNGERELRKIVVWWSLRDSARSGINVKFQVHDFTTGEWQDITDSIHHDFPPEAGMAGCLTLTFPEGEFKNFDSLRMIDGRRLFKAPGTRWIEVEAYTAPDNK
jgi:hypothetical protein